ncbi:formimidoylglutamase [Halalkalibacterium halodurans]|uniref:formimidoylglutamase n=1 Tax=Halalkalibacterium halodurans TaxID=86665 RepID=UPI0038B3F9C0
MRGEERLKGYPFLDKANAPFVDRHVTKAGEIFYPWDGKRIDGFGLIGAPLSKSSISHSGASFAPTVIRKCLHAFSTYSVEEDLDLAQLKLPDLGDITMHVTDIVGSQARIEETMTKLLENEPNWQPIVLGGDHSISFPSIKAFASAKGTVGVIQFDAHHDLRNLEDGGPCNGTPFRSLLETGSLVGEHLVQVGIRDFSNSYPYRKYAEKHGVKVYTMKDVNARGILTILDEAVAKLKRSVDVIYVSVDMDVLDQAHAPGCPAISPGGMDSTTLLQGIFHLGKDSLVQGMDIVEVDPTLDFREMTSRAAAHVILNYLKGKCIKSIG